MLMHKVFHRAIHNMVKARKYVFVKQFEGLPKATDLKLEEEELPPIKDGGTTKFLIFNLTYKFFV